MSPMEVPREPIRVYGDPLRLTQALGNVLTNAAKYTKRAGRISLVAPPSGDVVEIRVRDTGVGIPSAHLPMIFEMFTQLRNDTGRSQSGLGIGLALVRKLLEMHGGTVAASSEGDGLGSEFLITLPVISNDKVGVSTSPGHQANGDDASRGAPVS